MKKLIIVLILISLLITACNTSTKNIVTLKKYNEIQIGMTYDEIVEIVGIEGELFAEVGEIGPDTSTATISYSGDKVNGNSESSCEFIFEIKNQQLLEKNQTGLQ